jgi:hypothetical protein
LSNTYDEASVLTKEIFNALLELHRRRSTESGERFTSRVVLIRLPWHRSEKLTSVPTVKDSGTK